MFPDAVVDSFVMAAEDNDIALEGEFVGNALVEGLSVRSHKDKLVVIPLGLEFLYHSEDGLDHHHHSGITAVTVVIDVLSRADSVFAGIVDMNLDQSLLFGAFDYRMVQRTLQKLRHYCQYVYSHKALLLYFLQNYPFI